MSHEVLVPNEEARTAKTEVEPRELLNQVVESVRRDSQQGAQAFLSETTVPHGGE